MTIDFYRLCKTLKDDDTLEWELPKKNANGDDVPPGRGILRGYVKRSDRAFGPVHCFCPVTACAWLMEGQLFPPEQYRLAAEKIGLTDAETAPEATLIDDWTFQMVALADDAGGRSEGTRLRDDFKDQWDMLADACGVLEVAE